MPYLVIKAPAVDDKLSSLEPDICTLVQRAMVELAENPEARGQRAVCPPYPPIGYTFHKWIERHGEERRMLTIFFVYGDDLQSIVLTGFALSPFVTKGDLRDFADIETIELPARAAGEGR